MEIKDIIKSRRNELSMTMKELADKVGVSEGTISRWESGKISEMRRDKIYALANALGISPAIVMGWAEFESVPHPDLKPIGKQRFPLYDGIAAGEPRLMPDGIECYIDITTDIKADFVLKVHGDSMIGARINDGDLVFIRQQPTVENGEIAAVVVDDSATLKRVFWYANRSLLVLRAENPKYKDLEYAGNALETVKILGKAVAFQSDIR